MSKHKHNDNSWKVSAPYAWIFKQGTSYIGDVVTKYGIVGFCYSPSITNPFTTLDLVHNGRQYQRTYNRVFANRYLVTLAARFAEEMSGGKQ